MGSPNAFISNGTCYSAPGQVSPFFPCGNDALGHKTCCQGGDLCLSSKACFNARFGVTYLAGCSDPEFADASCPDKGAFANQPWAGLVYCNGTSEQWVACKQAAAQTTVTSADACFCPQTSRTVAFTDASILTNIVSLPPVLGGSVVWQPGYVPTPVEPSTTASMTSNSATTTASQTSGPTSTSPSSGDTGLSSGAKIGIGVGIGVGASILLAVIAFHFITRRRRNKQSSAAELDNSKPEDGSPQTQPSVLAGPRSPATPNTAVSELEPNAARPWSMRSELDSTPQSIAAMTGSSDNNVKIQDRLHPDSKGHSPVLDQKPAAENRPTGPVAELPA